MFALDVSGGKKTISIIYVSYRDSFALKNHPFIDEQPSDPMEMFPFRSNKGEIP